MLVITSGNRFNKFWHLFVNLAIAAFALGGVMGLQWVQLDPSHRHQLNPKQAEAQEALRLKLLKNSPTLGYDNLIADWAFLSLLQYYGDDEARSVTGYSLNADYFDLITQRDPRFVAIYPYLSTAISFYLGNPRLAVQYMTRGTNVLSPEIDPFAFLVWRFKGLDQLLLMGDTDASIHSHEIAALWAKNVNPDLAAMYRETAEFLKTDPDSTLIRFRCWVDVFYNAVDKRVKQKAVQEIYKLGGTMRTNSKGEIIFDLDPKKIPPTPKKKPKVTKT